MKRFWLIFLLLCAALARAQDPATEERLNKLSGQIEDLLATQAAQQKRLSELSRQLADLREQASRPNPLYASQQDLRRLADALREVDQKRLEDYDKIRSELLKLGKTLAAAPPLTRKPVTPAPTEPAATEKNEPPEKGFEYVVQKGDRLEVIIEAYREKGIKVSRDQIIKANAGLKPDKLRAGQKLFIPAPNP